MKYPVYWPRWLQAWLLPKALCHLKTTRPTLYLTFDDGPIATVTPWVLEQLAQFEAKATFFCVGANVTRHPTIYNRILEQGHRVGNHTQNHCNGWRTQTTDYLQEVASAKQVIDSPLFRPPYGRLTRPQRRALLEQGYQLVYWEILAGDFDASISWKRCYENIIENAQTGSIVVLHDSQKAWPHLQQLLPLVLEHYSKLGWQLAALP